MKDYYAALSFSSIALQILQEAEENNPALEGKVLFHLAAAQLKAAEPDLDKVETHLKCAFVHLKNEPDYQKMAKDLLDKVTLEKKKAEEASR